MPSEAFFRSLSEDAGCRSGFALGEVDMLEHLGADHRFAEAVTSHSVVRLASSDYGDTVGDLLFSLGVSRAPGMPPLSRRFLWNIGLEPGERFDVHELMKIEALGTEYARRKIARSDATREILKELRLLLGSDAEIWFPELMAAIDEEIGINPFYVKQLKNPELISLNDLFHSEELPSDPDRFFDQRFIDYLDRNPEDLKRMHWRKFEALTAEWFQSQGYKVELGPGRNDGNVDIRLWKDEVSQSGPPTIIVQCKRHKKRKVKKVTVKALYADLAFEGATGAMVVTTSDVSPGAKRDIEAREYPITTANLEAVTSWLSKMRTPGCGFLNFED